MCGARERNLERPCEDVSSWTAGIAASRENTIPYVPELNTPRRMDRPLSRTPLLAAWGGQMCTVGHALESGLWPHSHDGRP